MASSNRVGGVLNMTIDGQQYALRGNFEVSPSSVKREPVAGQDGPHGYTETPLVPGIKGDLTTVQGLSLTALQAIVNSTIQCTLANGTTYVLSQAWCNAGFAISTAEGKVGVDFGGMACDEI